MKRYIIIINGKPRAGKDTFVKLLAKNLGWDKYYYRNFSSIDPVKAAAKVLGWDGEKTGAWRGFLSDLKGAWVKRIDGPFKYIVDLIKITDEEMECKNKTGFIFIHIREPEEIRKIVDYYGDECTTIFIMNKNVPEIKDNDADSGVTDYEYQYYIGNHGDLDEYAVEINGFINYFLER